MTPEIKMKIVEEANWRSTNGHGGVDDVTRDNFILAATYGYELAQSPADSIPDQDAEKDRFAIAFSCWAMFDPQAKAYRDAGISAGGLLDKYKSRPYVDQDTSKQ